MRGVLVVVVDAALDEKRVATPAPNGERVLERLQNVIAVGALEERFEATHRDLTG